MRAFVAALLLVGALLVPSSPAGAAPVIDVGLDDQMLTGTGFGSGLHTFDVRILDAPAGSVLWQSSFSDDGDFFMVSLDGNAAAGRYVEVDVDGDPGKQLLLAPVSIDLVDTGTDAISGGATPSGTPDIRVEVFDSSGAPAATLFTAASSGAWSVDTTSQYDLQPEDTIQAYELDADGDSTYVIHGSGGGGGGGGGEPPAPYIVVNADDDLVTGYNFTPDADPADDATDTDEVTIEVTDGSTPKGDPLTVDTDAGGFFQLSLFANGIAVVAGDVVIATDNTSAAEKQVELSPVAVTSANSTDGVIEGTASLDADPSGTGSIEVTNYMTEEVQSTDATSGAWSVTMTALSEGDEGTAAEFDADGDATEVSWTAEALTAATRLEVNLTTDTISGFEWAPGETIDVMIDSDDSGSGSLRALTETTDELGYFEIDLGPSADQPLDLVAGMFVTAEHAGSSTTRVLELPPLTALADAGTDTVAGTGWANDEVLVTAYDAEVFDRVEPTDANGDYSADLSGDGGIAVGDMGYVTQADADGDLGRVDWQVYDPVVQVDRTRDEADLSGFPPNADVTVTVDGGHDVVVNTDSSGAGLAQFFAVDIVPGSVVTATDDTWTATHTVTAVAITSIDAGSDAISGTATDGATVRVHAESTEGIGSFTEDVTATGGVWTATTDFDLVPGDTGEITEFESDDVLGDATSFDWVVPDRMLIADLDANQLIASGFQLDSTVDLTVDRDTTTPVNETDYPVDVSGSFTYDFTWQTGDVITVTDDTTTTLTVVHVAVTSIDPAADTISGVAPAGTEVLVEAQLTGATERRTVTADDQDVWTADFSVAGDGEQVVDITEGTDAWARALDAEGDATQAGFTNYEPLLTAEPGTDLLAGNDFAPNTTLTVELVDGADQVDSRTVDILGGGFFQLDYGAEQIDLAPGMTITATGGGLSAELLVADIRIETIDTTGETVSGTATPGASIEITRNGATPVQVTADGSTGAFTATIGAGIEPGDTGTAIELDADGDQTKIDWVAPDPVFSVRGPLVEGTGWLPTTELTVTVTPTGPAPTVIEPVTTAGDGSFSHGMSAAIAAGDHVQVDGGGSSRELTVAALSVTGADAGAGTISGTGPTSEPVTVEITHSTAGTHVLTPTADGSGDWTANFTGTVPLEGDWIVAVEHADDDGDTTGLQTAFAGLLETVTASQTVTTDTSTGPTAEDVITTTVTSATNGDVEITEGPSFDATTTSPPPDSVPDYAQIAEPVVLGLPSGATTGAPHVVRFAVDITQLQGSTAAELTVLRDGTEVPPCTGSHSEASPDPCLATASATGDGDAALTVRTTTGSTWVVALAQSPPSLPQDVVATADDGEALVEWNPPSSTGDGTVTGYTITASPGGATQTTDAGVTSTTFTGLTNGTEYTFTVVVNSTAGDSDGGTSNPVTPSGVPGAPADVTAIAGDGSATVSWSAPTDDGGTPVTGYQVTHSGGGATSSVGAEATQLAIDGLDNGTAYTFTVKAVNVNGAGPGTTSDAVTPQGPPSSPTDVAATAGHQQATISWSAPADDGGAAITGYRVTVEPGGVSETVGAAAQSYTATGLTNGVGYTLTVAATNNQGTGPAVTRGPVHPNRAPVAGDDSTGVAYQGTVDIDVGANDSDPDGDSLSLAVIAQPAQGTVSVLDDGRIRYTATGASGADTFTYRVRDPYGGEDTATVTVTVAPPEDDGSADETVQPGGQASSGDGQVGQDDPVEVTVTSPSGGRITIEEVGTAPPTTPAALVSVGIHIDVTAPAESPDDPLVLTFTVADHLVPADLPASAVEFLRDGVLVAHCKGSQQVADPDPCLYQRRPVDGGTEFTVLTSGASTWSIAVGQVNRLSGLDRFRTATAATAAHFEPGVADVYVATGRNYPDALVAGAVAGLQNVPVLLVERTEIPETVRDELERLKPERITVVGGTVAVSDTVADLLASYATSGQVRRLKGDSRYLTANAVSQDAFPDGAPVVYLATGRSFPDALAGAVPAARANGPVLLTEPGALPADVVAELQRLDPQRIVLLGGTGAITTDVEVEVAAATDATVVRLGGENRYETAVKIVADAFDTADTVYLATGGKYPDALVAGPLATLAGAPVVLVPSSGVVPSVVTDLVESLGASRVVVLGGEQVVPSAIVEQVSTALSG